MIKAEHLTKTFGEVEVLKGINLEVNKGEIVSIVGASGAGKTTLLQILGTLLNLDSGKILIDGIDVSILKEKQLSRFRNKSIGFVFQFHHLLPEFTALENVCIPAFIAKTSKRDAEARAKELMNFLNLGHRLGHKPNQLSGGEKQRVAIARALINNPAVIFADEPTAELDTHLGLQVVKLFKKLTDSEGMTIVMTTHDPGMVEVADRVYTLEDGEITK